MSTAIKPQEIGIKGLVRWKAYHPGSGTRDQYLDIYLGFLVTTLTLRKRVKSTLKLREEKGENIRKGKLQYLSAERE